MKLISLLTIMIDRLTDGGADRYRLPDDDDEDEDEKQASGTPEMVSSIVQTYTVNALSLSRYVYLQLTWHVRHALSRSRIFTQSADDTLRRSRTIGGA